MKRRAFEDTGEAAHRNQSDFTIYRNGGLAAVLPFLSSGHRPTLLKFHRNVLQLSPDRDWRIEPSGEFEVLTAA
jgi:hypothetical protein